MRISAAAAALLVAVEAVADSEPSGENLFKLSRRHLQLQKHRLFPPKVRLDHRNDDSDESSTTKHKKKKSKMGNDWYELDEVQSLTDVETTETSGDKKQGQLKIAEDATATDEEEEQEKLSEDAAATDETASASHSTEEDDCTELVRRHLSKQDKAGKDSKVKSTLTSTWIVSIEEAQADSKSGKSIKGSKSAKAKTGKRSKSPTIKCQTVPPKSSDTPTVKPSQELPSGTSSPTRSSTPKPTEVTTTPEPSSTSTVVTESPIASEKTGSPTITTVVTASPTGSPSLPAKVTESPTASPSAPAVVTESPTASEISESPSVSGTSEVTTAPTTAGDTESPTTSSVTEAPVASVASEAPSTAPSFESTGPIPTYAPTAVTEAPVTSTTTNAPTVTVITGSPVSSAEKCTFCEGGFPDPDAEAAGTGGQTCAQVKANADEETNGSAICDILQEVESSCCPEPTAACTFCEEGISNPELVPPDTGGQTCAQIGLLAADDTEGSGTCTTIQAVESACCPQSESCAPLDPNPYTFEPPNNVFPVAPWTTGGDGVWTIDDTNAQEGTYSIKSPDLDGSEGTAVSNATLAICDDFAGGVLMFNTLAPVVPPYDILVWYVDGVEISRLAGEPEWSAVPISLPPGAHRIDFQYQYNPFSLPELPDDPPPIRQGAVWIDAVGLQIM
mmetsp:Transcript_39040/g.57588  ORF Transcript_39040/g.57588 Transcript_39040/m.57588 type:complete len:675 (-) Transcript_39040:957-2981(-)